MDANTKYYDVIVTGSSGFVGKYLCEKLIENGYNTLGVDKVPPEDNVCDFLQHDLTQKLDLDVKASLCVHLAATVGGIIFNNEYSDIGVEYNEQINSTVADMCSEMGIDRLVYFSSINVFETSGTFAHEPLDVEPRETGYAISKASGEKYFENIIKHLCVIRPTNIFGKKQIKTHSRVGESHVIPDLLHKIDNEKILYVMGDGSQIRNFVHVLDIVNFVIKNIKFEGKMYMNLRSKITITISNLVKELMRYKKKDMSIVYQREFMQYEKFKIRDFDMGPAEKFGWMPKYDSIANGLEY